MSTITIDFADAHQGDPCPCCGGRTTTLTRFVNKDGDAYAVYYAAFAEGHAERWVRAIISMGGWGGTDDDEAGDEIKVPPDRVAFALQIRAAKAEYQMGLFDAAKSLWHDAEFLGTMLTRDQAKKHHWLKEVFHIADHIVTDDALVKDYLDAKQTRA